MSVAGIKTMQDAIIDYIKANMPKNNAHIGRVSGKRIMIGNKSYGYIPAVDMYFGEGDNVACILPDNANAAVVVGVT